MLRAIKKLFSFRDELNLKIEEMTSSGRVELKKRLLDICKKDHFYLLTMSEIDLIWSRQEGDSFFIITQDDVNQFLNSVLIEQRISELENWDFDELSDMISNKNDLRDNGIDKAIKIIQGKN